MRRLMIPLLLAALGCGSDSTSGPPQTQVVQMQDFTFSPTPVTIQRNQAVRWTNTGQNPHNTTSDTGIWSSGDIAPGGTFERTFTTAGTFDYTCTLHPGMEGRIIVQ